MASRLLILLLEGASQSDLEAAVEAHGDGYPSVYVVAPAHVGALEWLATDEGRAHGEAGARLLEAEWLLDGSGDIAGEAGDADPVQAVDDALRRFPADEIVVVGRGALDASLVSSLESFGLPVGWAGLSLRPDTMRSRLHGTVRSLASGRSTGTPFVAFVGANVGLLLIGVVVSVVAGLAVWLLGML